jgi:hypothetical protein
VETKVISRAAILGLSQGLLLTFLAVTRDFAGRSVGISQNVVVAAAKQPERQTCTATVGVTILPSGSATTKNGFNRLGVADCPALSPEMQNSSLAFPDRIKLPNEIRFRIIEIATTIAATITDNRKKPYCTSWCGVRCSLDAGTTVVYTLARIHVFGYATNELGWSGRPSAIFLVAHRTCSIKELAPKFVAAGSQEGWESFIGVFEATEITTELDA